MKIVLINIRRKRFRRTVLENSRWVGGEEDFQLAKKQEGVALLFVTSWVTR